MLLANRLVMRRLIVLFVTLLLVSPSLAEPVPILIGQFHNEGEGGDVGTIRFFQIGDQLKIALRIRFYDGVKGLQTHEDSISLGMSDWPELKESLLLAINSQKKFDAACLAADRDDTFKLPQEREAVTLNEHVGTLLSKSQKRLTLQTAFVQNYVERLNFSLTGPQTPEISANVEVIGDVNYVRLMLDLESAYTRWLARQS